MKVHFAVYNVEWMKDLFKNGLPLDPNDLSLTGDDLKHAKRSQALANVVKKIDADLLCLVEGPDTLSDGSKTSVDQLHRWRDLHGLDSNYKAIHGLVSRGQQELCALYKSDKIAVTHVPETTQNKKPFDLPFLVDTTDSLIHEQYRHFRPPLELAVADIASPTVELARVIVAHTKSKGIFDKVDWARFEQLSERDRKRLFAECFHIRERCDQWFEDDPQRGVIVCGDINDGFGVDYYERRFSRSAVELLLGDVWEPDRILKHVLPKPRLTSRGWKPWSSDFTDRVTRDKFTVLIDHILVSQGVDVDADAKVWNPFLWKDADRPADIDAIKDNLISASDHYPVSATLDL